MSTNQGYYDIRRNIQAVALGANKRIEPKDIETFFDNITQDTFLPVMSMAVNRKVIDPDLALEMIVSRFRTRESLVAMATCLRLGANVNSYTTKSKMHMLAYHYDSWRKNDPGRSVEGRFNMSIVLMIYYGANPNMPVFQDNTKTVIEWLEENNHSHELYNLYPNYHASINERAIIILAVLIGSDENIGNVSIPEDMIENIIHAGNNSILHRTDTPKENNGMDAAVIYWSVKYYNFEAFKYYVSMGLRMSYPLTNTLILRIKQYATDGDLLLYNIYLNMLEMSIVNGEPLDSYQQTLLSTASRQAYDRIMKRYQVPYWQKICNYRGATYGQIPDKLRKLALAIDLEIDNDHDRVCDSINNIASSNPDELVKAATARQRQRMISKHARIEEYLSGQSPVLNYFNQSPSDGDFNNYAEISIASYRDSGGRIWGFLSRDFTEIVERKVNPVNGTELPTRFIQEVSTKLEYLNVIGLDAKVPITHQFAINEIIKNDTVDNTKTDKILEDFLDYMSDNGVNRNQIRLLTAEQLDNATSKGGYNSTIRLLNDKHALITTAYVITFYRLFGPSKALSMVEFIRTYIYQDSPDNREKPLSVSNLSELNSL